MSNRSAFVSSLRGAQLLAFGVFAVFLLAGCSSEITGDPKELLLSPGDFQDVSVVVLSASEEDSLDGPSALVELEGPDFRVLQSLVVFASREAALSALDAIRADLVSRGATGPGQAGASGVFVDRIGAEEAAGLFFMERNVLVRLAVAGQGRESHLIELAELARKKLADG